METIHFQSKSCIFGDTIVTTVKSVVLATIFFEGKVLSLWFVSYCKVTLWVGE